MRRRHLRDPLAGARSPKDAQDADGGVRSRAPTDLREGSLRNAGLDISRCLRLRPDLTDDDRQGFKEVQGLLVDEPEIAFRELVDLRRSFIAPVPGQLGERIGPE